MQGAPGCAPSPCWPRRPQRSAVYDDVTRGWRRRAAAASTHARARPPQHTRTRLAAPPALLGLAVSGGEPTAPNFEVTRGWRSSSINTQASNATHTHTQTNRQTHRQTHTSDWLRRQALAASPSTVVCSTAWDEVTTGWRARAAAATLAAPPAVPGLAVGSREETATDRKATRSWRRSAYACTHIQHHANT